MRRHTFKYAIGLLALQLTTLHLPASAIDLVKRGRAAAIVVTPDAPTQFQREAIDDFVGRVKVSSGATLSIYKESDHLPSIKKFDRIILCDDAPATNALAKEEFRLVGEGNHTLYIYAKDISKNREPHNSRVTMWALSHIMERYMGVKWLWPGELGTITPSMSDISIPDDIDYSYQPKLVKRYYDMSFDVKDNLSMEWCARNQMAGERENYKFQHSFRKNTSNGDWFSEFSQTRPELLAQSPNGKPELYTRSDFFKLCVSNPDVQEEVLRRWRKAGSPNYWDITPNDGSGFCTCESCQALDKMYNDVEYTKDMIWMRKSDSVNLSGRYVWFWNQMITKMRQENPNVEVGVFLYSAYRYPPKNLKLEEGIVGEMCDGFDFSNWQNWVDAGISSVALRSNWLWMGGCAPHIPLRTFGSYIESARTHNMKHIALDAIHGFWATQGPGYYLTARLISHPEMSTDDVIDEYCDAFGSAAEHIKSYLKYWDDYHTDVVKYNIPAGGKLSQDPNGLYERVCREHFHDVMHPLKGHWLTLSYIYSDSVMAPAREILDRASASTTDKETLLRIDMLRDGLLMVDYVASYISADEAQRPALLKRVADAIKANREKYGFWSGHEIDMLKMWKIVDKSVNFDTM